MTTGTRFVAAAFVLLALTVVLRANEYLPLALQAPQAPEAPAGSASDYLGSGACARCHDVEHTQWKNSLHIKMTKPVAEATIVGDFREGTKFADHDRAARQRAPCTSGTSGTPGTPGTSGTSGTCGERRRVSRVGSLRAMS